MKGMLRQHAATTLRMQPNFVTSVKQIFPMITGFFWLKDR